MTLPFSDDPPPFIIAIVIVILICFIVAPAVTLSLLIVFGLIAGRGFFLRKLRSENLPAKASPAATPEPPPLLPSSSGAWLGSAAHIFEQDTKLVQSHTGKLRAQTQQSYAMGEHIDARLTLQSKLAQLANTPALVTSDPSLGAPANILTLTDIEETFRAVPELSAELRALLIRVLAARIRENVAR